MEKRKYEFLQALADVDVSLSVDGPDREESIKKIIEILIRDHPCGLGLCPFTNTVRSDCNARFIRSIHNIVFGYLEVLYSCVETNHKVILRDLKTAPEFMRLLEGFHMSFPTDTSLMLMNKDQIVEAMLEGADKLHE